MANPFTKCEVPSFSRCGDFTWGVKFYKWSPVPERAPFRGDFFMDRVALAMVNQCTKFEVSRFIRYEAMNGSAKYRKWGGLGSLKVVGNATIQ